MKRISLATVALLAALSVTAQNTNNQFNNSPLHKLLLAESAINQIYVDSVDENKVVEDAINGMLKQLDPHSVYTPAKDVKALTEPLEGNFEGIGVQYNMVEDT